MLKYVIGAGIVYAIWKSHDGLNRSFMQLTNPNGQFLQEIDDLLKSNNGGDGNGGSNGFYGVASNTMCPIESNNMSIDDKLMDFRCRPTSLSERAIFGYNLTQEEECIENCTNQNYNQLLAETSFGSPSGAEFDIQTAMQTFEYGLTHGWFPKDPVNSCATVKTWVTPPVNVQQQYDWVNNWMSTYNAATQAKVAQYLNAPACEFTSSSPTQIRKK